MITIISWLIGLLILVNVVFLIVRILEIVGK